MYFERDGPVRSDAGCNAPSSSQPRITDHGQIILASGWSPLDCFTWKECVLRSILIPFNLRDKGDISRSLPHVIRLSGRTKSKRKEGGLARHSLTFVAVALLLLWFAGYVLLDEKSHLGAFCGNAIADWSGSLVIILGTKFLLEKGSAESKPVKRTKKNPALELLHEHSLLLFIIVTGIGWAVLFWKTNPESKWGQVAGNVVSEWVQMAGLVFLTKRLIEVGSKE